LIQSNLAIRNFLVALKLFLNAKCSLSLWSKWQIGHRKWFLNTNKFLIKPFLIAKFDCTFEYQKFVLLSIFIFCFKTLASSNRSISEILCTLQQICPSVKLASKSLPCSWGSFAIYFWMIDVCRMLTNLHWV
jgi:hypothetical protein